MALSLHRRAKKTTIRQYGIMLDYFENHPEMINGKTTDIFTTQRREELWTDLSVRLNSVTFGPQKTPQKWRRTWIDIKSEAKQREREFREQSELRGNPSPPPLPLHLARIMSLVRLANAFDQTVKENKSAVELSIMKDCFTEEILPETEMLSNGNLELNNEARPMIKLENLSDILSTSVNLCLEKVYDTPPTSVESPCQKVSDILSSVEMSGENISNISTTVKSPCRNTSEIPSTSSNSQTEENSENPPVFKKNMSKNVFDPSATSSEISREKNPNNFSKVSKTSCEKVYDILTTSVRNLNDVIQNSENRTITAFNALTKATVKANELREKQLQIEEERNRLYQERNEILFTLVNSFFKRK